MPLPLPKDLILKLKKLKSDSGRKQILEQTLIQASAGSELALEVLPPEKQVIITELAARFAQARDVYADSLKQRKRLSRKSTRVVNALDKELTTFWVILTARTLAQNLNPEVHTYYGLQISGTRPERSKRWDCIEAAQVSLNGEAKALADSYPAMPPERLEALQAVLTPAEEVKAEYLAFQSAHKTKLNILDGIRKEVDAFARKLNFKLRAELVGLSPARQRDLLRPFGFVFRGDVIVPEEEPAQETGAEEGTTEEVAAN